MLSDEGAALSRVDMNNTLAHPKIPTTDRHGVPNGFLIPIFNMHEGMVAPAQHPKQVYLTVVHPGATKGPHLHMKRWGLFTCIKGNAVVIVRRDGTYQEIWTGEDHQFRSIQVPAGVPAALQNRSAEDAYILNMPSPAWRVDDQDDHPVEFDEDRLIVPRD